MADELKPGETPEPTETPETPVAQTPEEMRAELERTRKALKDANREAADRRKKLDAFEAAEKKRADAELSEVERLKKDVGERDNSLTAAQQELRTERLSHAVELTALAMDFHDPDDALALLDTSAIEFDDAGRPNRASIKKALEALAKAKPHLVAKADTRSRDGSPPGRQGAPRPKPDAGDDKEREVAVQRSTGRYML